MLASTAKANGSQAQTNSRPGGEPGKPGVVCGHVQHHPCVHSDGTGEPAVLSASYMIVNPLHETTDELVALEHRDYK